MSKSLLTLVFLLVAVAVGSARHISKSGLKNRNPPTARSGELGIYDGTNTTIEKHPYMVSITVIGDLWCAGTIVSKSWVLTLASWITYWATVEYTVLVGTNSSDTGGQQYSLSSVIVNPNYTDGNGDFACAKINGEFTWSSSVKPIKLPTTSLKVDTKLMITGWGSTKYSDYGDVSPVLVQGWMKIVEDSVYDTYYFNTYGYVDLTETQACAYNHEKTTACLEDQGDPLIKNGVIYGLLSFIPSDLNICSKNSGPVVLSNVPPVAAWIKETTGASYENMLSLFPLCLNSKT